jgi:carboxylesterase
MAKVDIIPGGEPFYFPGNDIGCLLLHGLTGTPYEVRELGERLHGAGYTAVGPRLPGHATRYQNLDHVPWTAWADAVDVGWEMLAQRCEKVFIMGMSMGAVLALHAAARHPASGVVGLGSLWDLPRWQMRAARLMVRVRPYQRKRGGSSILDPAAKAKHPTYDHMNLHAVLQFNQLLTEMRAALPQVTAPALLVHSRKDPVASPAGVPKILEALGSQDKMVHWVSNSSHIITEDYDKEEVFRIVLAWVARILAAEIAEGGPE